MKKLSEITKTEDDFVYGILGYVGQNENDRSCLLKYSERQLELIIPFEKNDSEVAEWFTSFHSFLPEIDSGVELPRQLWVTDLRSRKRFILINPKVVKSSVVYNNMGSFGFGALAARYIVVGNSEIDYIAINEMKTEYPELLDWTKMGSVVSRFKMNQDNTCESYYAGYESSEEIRVMHNDIECCLFSNPIAIETIKPKNRITIENNVSFRTKSENTLDIYEHEKLHRALNGLISILQWRSVGWETVQVRNYTDFQTKPRGEKTTPFFRDVLSEGFFDWEKPKRSIIYAFALGDIGQAGFLKWFKLYEECRRGLSSLVYLARNHQHLTLETQINELAQCFVEIAYCLGQREGRDVSRLCFSKLVELVLSSITDLYIGLPITEKDSFISDFRNTYNSVKHTEPSRGNKERAAWLEPTQMYQVVNASKALLVIWIASELGAAKENVYRNIECENATIDAFKRWRARI